MKIVAQGGVRVSQGNGTILLTPDEFVRVAAGLESPQPFPLKDLYFYAQVVGVTVSINSGLLVFPALGYAGLGVDVIGGVAPYSPFIISTFTPSTDGFIYYEAEVSETQGLGTSGASSGLVPIGTGSYTFSASATSFATVPGAGFVDGTMVYSTSRPSSAPGYYRKVICSVSVNADGEPFNVKQEHVGVLFISSAEIYSTYNFTANVA